MIRGAVSLVTTSVCPRSQGQVIAPTGDRGHPHGWGCFLLRWTWSSVTSAGRAWLA